MAFGLSKETIDLLCTIFTRYPEIEEVKVYGSRAMDNYEKGSDIDLAFFTHSGNELTGHLLTELDELPTPYLFDVTDYYRIISLSLKEHIDRAGKIIYKADNMHC